MHFDNSYARLPQRFFARQEPSPVAAPKLIRWNDALASDLGLDPKIFARADYHSGNALLGGSEPLAMAYAGHQFGQFVPQLGDGRAILLGEIIDRFGKRRDIQLKGSGRTAFSRNGDGRAALGPVLREYIVSEAMAALGIPTTRALAVVTTGERVQRETALPGAILSRVAASHIRIGTFQYFAARGDAEGVRILADYVIARHYPAAAEAANPYRALLDGVIDRQASLIARWLLVGFIHGVMNTDNMAVSGETIDYGPCAFLDAYDPAKSFSAIDRQGRYAYGMQPRMAQWNLARFAECLLPLLGADEEAGLASAQEALDGFGPRFEAVYGDGLTAKLGFSQRRDGDVALAQDLLARMEAGGADITRTFRGLADAALGSNAVRDDFADPAAFDAWAPRWRARLAEEGDGEAAAAAIRAVSPAYIPRNHRIAEVIDAALRGDYAPFEILTTVLSRPFEAQPAFARYAEAPRPEELVEQTFCGT